MKKMHLTIIVLGLVFIGLGIGGYMYSQNIDETPTTYSTIWNQADVTEPYSIDELTKEVKDYIGRYEEALEISDIFVFSDSEYYFSIVEQDTHRGAMELLVNPYTKEIFPEYGPNMMWNLKYGMHSQGGHMGSGYMSRGYMGQGHMGRGHMQRRNFDYGMMDSYREDMRGTFDTRFIEDNTVSYEQAYNAAQTFLDAYDNTFSVDEAYHEFYGYYTFHVLKDNEPYGMLSVNGYTQEVWYHDWHADLVEIIENH